MSLKKILEKITKGWVSAVDEKFTGHLIASLVRKDLLQEVKKHVTSFYPSYEVKASAGAGNWASVPWVSILNPLITTSTQSGVYPVYLFCADGSGVYLSLGFGTTALKDNYGAKGSREKAIEQRNAIRKKENNLHDWNATINLHSSTNLGKSYEWASAGAKFYSADAIPEDSVLFSDLEELLKIYSSLEVHKKVVPIQKVKYELLPKPFLLLAGISGTGKTRFVKEQAKASGNLNETYNLVSVRPDWHEPSDLLGYSSRLTGEAEYITTDVLQFMVKAWRAIVRSGIEINTISLEGKGDTLVAGGEKTQLSLVLPYWLCLDEMNLAPVEQYFADYLSVLETREWLWQGDQFTYHCDPILKAHTINQLSPSGKNKLRNELELEGEQNQVLWDVFCEHGIGIPFNMIVAGTVNMDETTHGFSRKVIDRALSFDFGEFFPNDFDDFFEPSKKNKLLSYPLHSNAQKELLPTIDADGQRSIKFLQAVNTVLDNTPFKLAYRALNELLLAVISHQPQSEKELQAVWDDYLMCKILPRIEGDTDKLAQNDVDNSLLAQLFHLLGKQLIDVWDKPTGSDQARPDLYRNKNDGSLITIACRSKAKIAWMQNNLLHSGFSSFWP
jgi:hypothetical protein